MYLSGCLFDPFACMKTVLLVFSICSRYLSPQEGMMNDTSKTNQELLQKDYLKVGLQILAICLKNITHLTTFS